MSRNGYVEGIPIDEQCWHHGPEPAPTWAYRLCIECGHCYPTREDLETLDYAIQLTFDWPDFEATPRLAREIHTCPLCIHDF